MYRTFLRGRLEKSVSSFTAVMSAGLFADFSTGRDLEHGGCSAVSCAMGRDGSSWMRRFLRFSVFHSV